MPTKKDILAILSKINDPISGKDLIAAGMVESVDITATKIRLVLATEQKALAAACQSALETSFREQTLQIILTKHNPPPSAPQQPITYPKPKIDANAVIAIASGKGGVGKSTVAVNLAVAFARAGLRCGLLDADIYGPSTPIMMGVNQKPETQNKKIIPLEVHGVKFMSIGLMVDPEQALVWRGPMVHSAISQMLDDVMWGALDILLIDMPPGTGDAQLTLAQKQILSGAIIVSTPQNVALADVRRILSMFQTTHIPILGIIENMAWFEDQTKTRHHIFGESGAKQLAEQQSIPFLGELPLDPALCEASDQGKPHAQQERFNAMAAQLRAALKL